MWSLRLFLFDLVESPRYLVGKGKDEEAVVVLHKIAAYNSTTSTLTVEQLTQIGSMVDDSDVAGARRGNLKGILSRTSNFTISHIKALFATKEMARSTSLLISIWGIIGLASTLYNNFLPFLLASRGAHFGDSSLNITYRNTLILAVVGVPAALAATWAVEVPYIGRKGTLAISAGLTSAFLFASTTARNSNALLGWNCGYTFSSNIMYGVLYAITPEIFPAKDRGTGNGLVFTTARVFGLIAPIIALYANLSTAVPVYISGALILLAGGLALLIPYEPRGKASM